MLVLVYYVALRYIGRLGVVDNIVNKFFFTSLFVVAVSVIRMSEGQRLVSINVEVLAYRHQGFI